VSYPAVEELLPHKAPMVLLDRILSWDGATARCGLRVREGAPFVVDGKARAAVALEYMAQCVGVCTALRSLERGEPLRMGYLVGARTMTLAVDRFDVGDELVVAATEEADGDELGLFACETERGGSVVVSATLSVYRGARRRPPSP